MLIKIGFESNVTENKQTIASAKLVFDIKKLKDQEWYIQQCKEGRAIKVMEALRAGKLNTSSL